MYSNHTLYIVIIQIAFRLYNMHSDQVTYILIKEQVPSSCRTCVDMCARVAVHWACRQNSISNNIFYDDNNNNKL